MPLIGAQTLYAVLFGGDVLASSWHVLPIVLGESHFLGWSNSPFYKSAEKQKRGGEGK